jgi:hypothetical protein
MHAMRRSGVKERRISRAGDSFTDACKPGQRRMRLLRSVLAAGCDRRCDASFDQDAELCERCADNLGALWVVGPGQAILCSKARTFDCERETEMTRLQRTTFEASRAAEYFDARQLSALTGVPREMFLNVCLKERGDNALGACETAAVAPEVSVTVEYQLGELCRLSVSDNGPGMPSELIDKILDYNVRVSDAHTVPQPRRRGGSFPDRPHAHV